MQAHQILSVEVIRLLSRIGLFAAERGHHEAAQDIFASLRLVRPKEPNVIVCQAVVLCAAGHYAAAAALLRRVLVDWPRHMGIRSTLGYAMFHAGEACWWEHLEMVMVDASDAGAVALAQQVLDERTASSTAAARRSGFHAIARYV